MPYALIRNSDGSYAVKNKETGAYKAKHSTKESAKAQIRLLMMIDKRPK
jgi:hypothetical protein